MTTSTFCECLIGLNALQSFSSWAFHHGMLFGAQMTWWGTKAKRRSSHEGLDLCLYVDGEGRPTTFGVGKRVPVIYQGHIIKIDDDFLGKSIYVKHAFRDGSGNVLYTAYGHTKPAHGTDINVTIGEGEVIATIADTRGKKTAPPPHLHISMVWAPESLPEGDLNWDTISARQIVKPVDPLEFLALPYVLLR